MAGVFDETSGWVETSQLVSESILPARGYTPSTARWCGTLLNPTQCLTEDGKELTRVYIIDYESEIVVYDELVNPPKPVIDYLAKYRFHSLDARTPPTI
jgi:RNA exonuclease 1